MNLFAFCLAILFCSSISHPSEDGWIQCRDAYPPAHGDILIYAKNGHFISWRPLADPEDGADDEDLIYFDTID